tara:strand:- start:2861 stop:3568 length:708 start_codon:yes stop_codon:yes gene_type:complete
MSESAGPDPDRFSPGDREFIFDIINRGARRVYYPDNLQDGMLHKWSFLEVRFEIQTTSGVAEYLLPEDCGGVIGQLSYDSADSGYSQVFKADSGDILKWRSTSTNVSSYPQTYAEEFVHEDGMTSQRRRLMLWPDPDAAYTLNGTMEVDPLDMDEKRLFGYGGKPIVEVLLASMLALIDPSQNPLFQSRLRAATQHDMLHNQPEFMGNLNRRRGRNAAQRKNGQFWNFDNVTHTG